jgi:hypothetical protein
MPPAPLTFSNIVEEQSAAAPTILPCTATDSGRSGSTPNLLERSGWPSCRTGAMTAGVLTPSAERTSEWLQYTLASGGRKTGAHFPQCRHDHPLPPVIPYD